MAHLKAKKACPTQAPFAFLETGFVFVSLFLLKLVQRFHNRIERFVLTGESHTERPATPIDFSPRRLSTCVGVITRRSSSIGISRCSRSNNGQTCASKPGARFFSAARNHQPVNARRPPIDFRPLRVPGQCRQGLATLSLSASRFLFRERNPGFRKALRISSRVYSCQFTDRY